MTFRRAHLLAVLASLAPGLALAETPPYRSVAPPSGPQQVPGSFIVRWKTARRRPIDRVGRQRVVWSRHIGERSTVFRTEETSARATEEALAELRRTAGDDIAEVVPVYYRYPFRVPSDPWYDLQWHLHTANLAKAWDITTGRSGVRVAVIDTGILRDHPDFDPRRLADGYDFVSNLPSAADGDGWDADPADPGSSSPSSSGLHGTHVAGIIGAASDNELGVTGVDWACQIVPIRALGAIEGGRGEDADIAAAIRWAAGLSVPGVPDNPTPANIINLSFGAEGDNSELRAAVLEAQERGTIVVAAAGNFGVNAYRTFPAAYPSVVTVGATDFDNGLAVYSNFGAVVKIMAPGGQKARLLPGTSLTACSGQPCTAGIYSLYRMGESDYTYAYLEGTSQAAPIVSGILSLMLTMKPGMDVHEVLYVLGDTADHSAMCQQGCGSGLVNAEGAVAMAAGNPIRNDTRAPFKVPTETILGSCAMGGAGQPTTSLPVVLLVLVLGGLRRRRRFTP